MARARPRQGRQAREIGAAIIGAWFKVLPEHAVAIQSISRPGGGVTTIAIPNHGFAQDDLISFTGIQANVGSSTGLNGPTYKVKTPSTNSFNIVKQDNSNILNPEYGTPVSGTGYVYKSRETVKDELEQVIETIIDGDCTVVIDNGTIYVPLAEPPAPDRSGLATYLQNYHNATSGRQYHEDLGTAILFGCGK